MFLVDKINVRSCISSPAPTRQTPVGGGGGGGGNLYYLLGKGGYVFGSVGLSVCLFVCEQHYSKSYERIGMKFYGQVLSSTSKN